MGKVNKNLKTLVITMQKGMRKEVRRMIEGRPLKLRFNDTQQEAISNKSLNEADLVCLAGLWGTKEAPILVFFGRSGPERGNKKSKEGGGNEAKSYTSG